LTSEPRSNEGMNEMETRQEGIAKVAELVKGIRVAMLTTVDESGQLRARPMAVEEVEFDGSLWFFTQEHSEKVGEIQRERQVCIAMSDPGKQRYISLSGTARLVLDRDKMKELWSPLLNAWFKDGLDDPELALLKVNVDSAEYWDGRGSKVVQLLGMAKAALTGREYDVSEHAKVELL